MKVTSVSATVNKMFSDGNYGHQNAQVTYTADLEDGEDSEYVVGVLLARASAQIAVELGHSETLNIRRAIHPRPHVCNHCNLPLDDWESYIHKACDETVQAEREARRAQQNAAFAEETEARELADMPF